MVQEKSDEIEFLNYLNEQFNELPDEIIEKSKQTILSALDKSDIEKIRAAIDKDPLHWIAPYHFNWGMRIRNLLRDRVCLDCELPSMNWDNYYSQLIEYAVEKRQK